MENENITLTAEELQQKIDDAVAKAVAEKTAEMDAKHNSEMAQARQKAKTERENAVKKAQEDAKLSAEEIAKREFEEKQKQEHDELVSLREKVRVSERTEKLVKAGVPKVFAHDSRLLNAEDEQVDNVIATIKSEYEQLVPQGKETTSTNVGGNPTPAKTEKDKAFDGFRNSGFGK